MNTEGCQQLAAEKKRYVVARREELVGLREALVHQRKCLQRARAEEDRLHTENERLRKAALRVIESKVGLGHLVPLSVGRSIDELAVILEEDDGYKG